MAWLRSVQTIPSAKSPDGRWDADPTIAAFLAASRAVFEVYNEELPAARITARRGRLEFYLRRTDGEVARVEVPKHFDSDIGAGNLYIPASYADLDADGATCAALAVLHRAVLELAQTQDWPVAEVEGVLARVVERGLRFAWQGPWKMAPGRQHQARGLYRIAEDGLGRAQLEVREAGSDRIMGRTAEAVAFMTKAGLERSARTLTWADATTVRLVPWTDLGDGQLGLLELQTPNMTVKATPDIPHCTWRHVIDVDGSARRPRELTHAGRPRVPGRYLSGGGIECWVIGLPQAVTDRAGSAMTKVLHAANEAIDGEEWLQASEFVEVDVALGIAETKPILIGATVRFDGPDGADLLTILGVTATQLRDHDQDLIAFLAPLVREHLNLVGARRRLGKPRWNDSTWHRLLEGIDLEAAQDGYEGGAIDA